MVNLWLEKGCEMTKKSLGSDKYWYSLSHQKYCLVIRFCKVFCSPWKALQHDYILNKIIFCLRKRYNSFLKIDTNATINCWFYRILTIIMLRTEYNNSSTVPLQKNFRCTTISYITTTWHKGIPALIGFSFFYRSRRDLSNDAKTIKIQ